VVHANGPLTEKHRLRLAQLIVDDNMPVARTPPCGSGVRQGPVKGLA